MLEIRHLRYFVAVAEDLSFSGAATRLHIAQPALSRTIQQLERILGARLLARTRRSVELTPVGSVLLSEARLLLQRVEETERRIRRTAAGEEGELRLGYIGPPTQSFLGSCLKEFRSRYPRVSVVLEERTPERVWEMVARGRLTVGLTRPVLPQHSSGLETVVLRKEQLVAVLPPDHPLAKNAHIRWGQLINQPLVVLSRREGVSLHDAVLAACHKASFTPEFAHTPSLISTVLSYVEAGAGIGISSESIASLGKGLPLVFCPLIPSSTIELVMVWSNDNDTPPAAAFRKLLLDRKKSGQLV